MLKLLLHLWWLEKRRNFKKRDIAVALYVLFVYCCVIAGFFIGTNAAGAPVERLEAPNFVGYIIAIALLVPDIIMKITMKHDATFMDDYLKTKPIPEKLWSRFIVVSNVTSFWNYAIPLMSLPLLILVEATAQALTCFIVMILFSIADSLFVACYRRTRDHFLRFSIIAGWLLMISFASQLLALFFWAGTGLNFVMLLIAFAVIAGLTVFLANEENYDESQHKSTRQHSLGKVNLFTMQFYGLLRAKRIRNMVLLITIVFIADSYLFVWLPNAEETETLINCILTIVMPSLVLSQWTFGVEANFFQGLMTKPIAVRQLLRNCYYFYLILSLISALFIMPIMFITPKFTPIIFFGALFIAAFINLFNIPTCLFSTRLEIFSSSFFNMQGNNTKINLYSIALLIPLAILGGVWYLWGENVFAIVGIALGLASLAVHRPVIDCVARIFENRKYTRLETFSN